MKQFQEYLTDINTRLELPQPTRSRILLELAGDFEDLYQHYLAEGRDESQARQEAFRVLDLSEGALAEMVQVHTGRFRLLQDQLGAQRLSRWERGVFLAVLVFMGLATGRLVFTSNYFNLAGPFVWAVAAATLGGALLAGAIFYRITIKQDHRPHRLRWGLSPLLGLAVVDLLTGFIGFWFGLRQAAGLIVLDTDQTLLFLVNWLLGGSALLIAAFLGAILVALLWFALNSKVVQIETTEVAYLMGG